MPVPCLKCPKPQTTLTKPILSKKYVYQLSQPINQKTMSQMSQWLFRPLIKICYQYITSQPYDIISPTKRLSGTNRGHNTMFTLIDILQGCGTLVQLHSATSIDPAITFPEARDNSNHIQPGDLFIAIKGAHV